MIELACKHAHSTKYKSQTTTDSTIQISVLTN